MFESIDPNLITSFALLMNYFIYKELNYGNNFFKLLILLFFRWLADNLDGCVARRYKKTSKLGGFLDTISDFTLLMIFGCFIIKQLKLSKTCYIVWFIIFLITITHYNFWHDHSNLSSYKDDSINAIEFFVNNSWAYFLIFIIVYYIIKCRKKI